MSLLKMARVPAPVVEPNITVLEAVNVMARDKSGAVAVVETTLEKNVLRGIFTERDVMLRVVQRRRDPATTPVREVMTADVKTLTDAATPEEVTEVMLGGHLRHVPIVDRNGVVLGLLSIRALLQDKVDDLNREVHALEQYICNDSPGG